MCLVFFYSSRSLKLLFFLLCLPATVSLLSISEPLPSLRGQGVVCKESVLYLVTCDHFWFIRKPFLKIFYPLFSLLRYLMISNNTSWEVFFISTRGESEGALIFEEDVEAHHITRYKCIVVCTMHLCTMFFYLFTSSIQTFFWDKWKCGPKPWNNNQHKI